MTTETITPYRAARLAADELVQSCTGDYDYDAPVDEDTASPEDVLSIDSYTTHRVLLACGGPTRYVDFVFSGGEFWRAEYGDSTSGELVVVDLDDDEAETIADRLCYGLDALGGLG